MIEDDFETVRLTWYLCMLLVKQDQRLTGNISIRMSSISEDPHMFAFTVIFNGMTRQDS